MNQNEFDHQLDNWLYGGGCQMEEESEEEDDIQDW